MKTLLLLCLLVLAAFHALARPKPDGEPEPLQAADGGAPGMEGWTSVRGNSTWCRSVSGGCYFLISQDGTARIGKCISTYICSK
uniref:Crotamine-Var-1 n=1 Tax=Varanus glauerti TaxID=169841 RepID=M9T1K1_VARGA|nr:crotamine-Var-1 [Varanus glauerti]